jgi:hypothetical protein
LIKNENYIDCSIIGHSSDDNDETIMNFTKAGSNGFEKKPTNFKKVGNLIRKYVIKIKNQKYYE